MLYTVRSEILVNNYEIVHEINKVFIENHKSEF